jgi:hypothetical protein
LSRKLREGRKQSAAIAAICLAFNVVICGQLLSEMTRLFDRLSAAIVSHHEIALSIEKGAPAPVFERCCILTSIAVTQHKAACAIIFSDRP